jgi:hypothetical protein
VTTLASSVDRGRMILTGTGGGLVMDNIQSMDPDSELNQQIQAIISKPEMTEEDVRRKNELAYLAALYTDPESGELVFPWANILRALRSGAFAVGKAKLSGDVGNGVTSSGIEFPLAYDGPEPGKLYGEARFRLRKSVNKNPSGKKAMVITVRPVIPEWQLEVPVTVFNEVIGWDKFVRVVKMTGEAVGFGNARRLGYGRFTAEVTKLS